jgi:hypothetical protein
MKKRTLKILLGIAIVAISIAAMGFPQNDTMLDMTTVVDYEVTSDGLHLLTEDGNGYFLEIYK